MTRQLTVRVTDLFAGGPDVVADAVRRNLGPSMSSRVVGTAAGVVVTLETTLRSAIPGRRGRAVANLGAVLTAVHYELETAVAVPKAAEPGAQR